MTACLCGCGNPANPPYKYCKGHNLIVYVRNLTPEKKKERYKKMVKTLKKTIKNKTKEQWAIEGAKRTATRKKRYGKKWCSNPEERNRKMSNSRKKTIVNPKTEKIRREKISKTLTRRLKEDTVLREQHIRTLRKAACKQISKPEYKARKIFAEAGLFFVPQYKTDFIKNSYRCDIFFPSKCVVVEIDGTYWHNYPYGNKIDHIRTKELEEAGYKVFRIWDDKDLEKNVNKVIDYIDSLPKWSLNGN